MYVLTLKGAIWNPNGCGPDTPHNPIDFVIQSALCKTSLSILALLLAKVMTTPYYTTTIQTYIMADKSFRPPVRQTPFLKMRIDVLCTIPRL